MFYLVGLCELTLYLLILSSRGQGQAICVAVGNDMTSGLKNSIAYSSNGKFWSAVASRIYSQQGNAVEYSPDQNLWVSAGVGTNSLAYSNGGITWIGLGLTTFTVGGQSVHYSSKQNLWVAGGQGLNSIAYSTDGKNWTGLGISIFSLMNGVTYSDSLDRWVGVGSGSTNYVAYSPDGKVWNGLGLLVFSSNANSVAFADNIFVVTGSGTTNSKGWSVDGISWVGSGQIYGPVCTDQAYGQNKWILTGTQILAVSNFANSSDGKTWSTQTQSSSPFTAGYGIYYSPTINLWIGMGQGQSTAWSVDGNNWTAGTNIFSTNGNKVKCLFPATTTTTNNLTSPPTNNFITSDIIGNVILNTSIIDTGYTINIDGSLTVNGDLYVVGTWILNNSFSRVYVSNRLYLIGNTNFIIWTQNRKRSIPISSGDLAINPNSQLTLILDNSIETSSTYQIINYNRSVGNFQTIDAKSTNPNQCLTTSVDYGQTSLSVTVNLNKCQTPNNNSTSSTFPIGAIIGIVVGIVFIGIGIGLIVIFVGRIRIRERTKLENLKLKEKSVADLRNSEGLKPSPGINL